MFHAPVMLSVFHPPINANSMKHSKKGEGPDFRPAFRGDEVYTPSPRRSEGRRDQLGGRCSSRAASKTSMPTLNEQRNLTIALVETPRFPTRSKKIKSFPNN
jgi:hypothetical protein